MCAKSRQQSRRENFATFSLRLYGFLEGIPQRVRTSGSFLKLRSPRWDASCFICILYVTHMKKSRRPEVDRPWKTKQIPLRRLIKRDPCLNNDTFYREIARYRKPRMKLRERRLGISDGHSPPRRSRPRIISSGDSSRRPTCRSRFALWTRRTRSNLRRGVTGRVPKYVLNRIRENSTINADILRSRAPIYMLVAPKVQTYSLISYLIPICVWRYQLYNKRELDAFPQIRSRGQQWANTHHPWMARKNDDPHRIHASSNS